MKEIFFSFKTGKYKKNAKEITGYPPLKVQNIE